MRLGLIGFGGIGYTAAEMLAGDPGVEFTAVAAREHHREAVRDLLGDVPVIDTADELLAGKPDIVIECASHAAFRMYAAPVLTAGMDLIAVSIGVLADNDYRAKILATTIQSGATLEIPSGAIGGIDVIAAARHAGLSRVTYETRKNARTWAGTPAESMIDLQAVREPTVFFDDTAERAALLFTEKANVTATLALAGIGFQKTRVRFWIDPSVTASVHRIEAEGACGTLTVDLANTMAPVNGKSSWLTATSIVRAVRNRLARLRL